MPLQGMDPLLCLPRAVGPRLFLNAPAGHDTDRFDQMDRTLFYLALCVWLEMRDTVLPGTLCLVPTDTVLPGTLCPKTGLKIQRTLMGGRLWET